MLLADNTTAWTLDANGNWQRAVRRKGERKRSTQQQLMARRKRRHADAPRQPGAAT